MQKVLIVEDDISISTLLRMQMADVGFHVTSVVNGLEALEKLEQEVYRLIVLDFVLPDISGLEICRQIRCRDQDTAIIFLTSRCDEIDKVLALETGADDYLTKPFSIREFLARVKAIFRRKHVVPDIARNKLPRIRMCFGDLEIDVEMRKVMHSGSRIELSPREFDLLVLLASTPGKSYNRQRLLCLVWGYEFEGYEHTVNSHINRLRNKIEPSPSRPKYILTTWGVGYRFNEQL